MKIWKPVKNLFSIFCFTVILVGITFAVYLIVGENLTPNRLMNTATAVFQKEGLSGTRSFCDNSYSSPTVSMGYYTWCSVYDKNGTPTLHITVTRKVDINRYVFVYGKDRRLY